MIFFYQRTHVRPFPIDIVLVLFVSLLEIVISDRTITHSLTAMCVKLLMAIGLEDAWWRHQMETFSALLAICAGNSLVPGEFPTQRPVTQSSDVYFDLRGWVNNREAGDLRRHRTHYDVIVMGMVNVKAANEKHTRYHSSCKRFT